MTTVNPHAAKTHLSRLVEEPAGLYTADARLLPYSELVVHV